ncbi:MAG: hypothetical protein AB1478_02240 [Nitrospirota bacterium]
MSVWIDYPNQVDRFYGGYGPGLHFYVETLDIEHFASQLEVELDALDSYFTGKKGVINEKLELWYKFNL